MAANIAPFLRQRYFNTNGAPLVGGKLYSYAANTTTPQATYNISTVNVLYQNANPVVLDANGEAAVFLDSSLSYKFVLKDSLDNVQWTVDNLAGTLTSDAVATASIQASAVTTAKIADDAVTADKLRDDASVDANRAVTTDHIRDYAITLPKLSSPDPRTNGFRLTLTTAVPVTTTDVTSATSIYCTPFKGNQIALYNGTRWIIRTSVEFSLALGTLTSGKPYDVFCYDNSGVATLEFLVWSSDTARATALALQDGVYVKSGTATRRYMGTFYTDSTTTTKDTLQFRYLFNADNQVKRPLLRRDTTASWTYNSATIRQANASTSNQVEVMNGLDINAVEVALQATHGGTGNGDFAVYIGLDSTTVVTTTGVGGSGNLNNATRFGSYNFNGYVGVGRHYLAWLETAINGGTSTFYGAWTGSMGGTVNSGLTGSCVL